MLLIYTPHDLLSSYFYILTSFRITPQALPKNPSESIILPHLQSQKSYVALLDIDLKIIKIGLKPNQDFSLFPLQGANFMLHLSHA